MLLFKICVIFILFSTIYADENAGDDADASNDNNGGFLFTVPKVLRSGKRETACLSLHGSKIGEKADVTVNIETTEGKTASAVTKKSFDADNIGCFELRIPEADDAKAKLHFQIKFPSEPNSTVNSVENVQIAKNPEVTFIQTDKEIYKPGDRVKIRILVLNHELGVPKNLMIPAVKIINPSGIAIGQWENVTTDLGLVQLEHQLSQETVTGMWQISLPGYNGVIKMFEVKEYVLPRFEVTLNHAENLYLDAESFNFSVCAKYSYGRFIKGTSHLKVEIMYQNLTTNQIKELENGCAEFSFERSELTLNKEKNIYYYPRLQLTATVTEQGTGQMQTQSSYVYLAHRSYWLEFVQPSSRFLPGIPVKNQVKIKNEMEELANKELKICYTCALKESYNYTAEQCKNISLNGSRLIDFTILPFNQDAVSISINAELVNVDNNTDDSTKFGRTYPAYSYLSTMSSPSNSYIDIEYEPSDTRIKCKTWKTFPILYTYNATSPNATKQAPIIFNYLIKSKGNIVKTGKVSHTPCSSYTFDANDYKNIIGNTTDLKPALPIDKLLLTIKISQKMFSESQLIVYYVRDDGEVVGSSVNFLVENCLANKVEANWSDAQNYPGEKSTYKIKTSTGSLCAVSSVDKKVSLLKATDNLKIETLLQRIEKPYYYDYSRMDCLKDGELVKTRPLDWDLRRKKRFYWGGSNAYDTFQIFQDSSLLVITDLKIITRSCMSYPTGSHIYYESALDNRVYYSAPSPNLEHVASSAFGGSSGYNPQAVNDGVAVRSYFPETWLWELVPVGTSGEIHLEKELPHSITQWLSNTICVSPSSGIGISSESIITTFKPFFIDVITPYSIKRNEVSHLKIVVYNYLNHSLPVGITLGLNSDMRLAGSPEESFITACIGPGDSISDTFRVLALGLGNLNFSITAEVDAAYPGLCGPEVLVHRKDIIEKSILVKPEGFPFERTLSNFVCAEDVSNDTVEQEEMKWNVEVPFDSIKNSSRLKILLDADLLGLTIENLGSLLRIPTGCGEQIMSSLAPNMYVLRYLKSSGNVSSEIEEKASNNMKIGYEKIMQYRHMDGSFSAFGEKYGNGSMFLTAFVLRTLSQAADYIYIDKHLLTNAAQWILEQQFENGCFPTKSHGFHSGMADESDKDNVALSAYVLISLLESRLPIADKVLDNAKYCLRGYSSNDKYTMSVITYALTLVNWESEANKYLERLLEMGNRKNGLLWWDDSEYSSNSLEMTSYIILSMIHTNNSQRIALAHEAIRWLLTKRNSYGGFISTQDTVVALDALTKFALVANKEDIDLTVSVATGGKHLGFRMRSKAKLKTKQVALTKFSNFVKFKVNGTGCILIQTVLRYNMAQIISSEALKLAVSTDPVSTIDKCSIRQVEPCFSYTVPNKHINMAVLEVSLPSGYRADRASLYELLNTDTKVQRFEEIDDKVVLYFTEVNDQKLCVPFLINEETVIENRTNTIVKLYDYYNPEVTTFTSYDLSNCSPIDLSS